MKSEPSFISCERYKNVILLKIRNSFIIRRSSDVLNRTIIDKILHNRVPKGGLLYPMIISSYCFGYRLDSFDAMDSDFKEEEEDHMCYPHASCEHLKPKVWDHSGGTALVLSDFRAWLLQGFAARALVRLGDQTWQHSLWSASSQRCWFRKPLTLDDIINTDFASN